MDKKSNNIKNYEIYASKNPVKQFEIVKKLLVQYEWTKNEKATRSIVYYDTPQQNLQLANILLLTDVSKEKSKIVIERNIEGLPNEKFIKMFEIYKLEEDFLPGDNIDNYIRFLSSSLPRLFSQPLTIDPDSMFKKVIPQVEIKFKNVFTKVVDFKGFKGLVTIEDVQFINSITKRKNFATFLKVEDMVDSKSDSGFEVFIERLEKYCKFILPINESLIKQALRMTKKLDKTETVTVVTNEEIEE